MSIRAPSAWADDSASAQARSYFKSGVELLKGNPPNYQDAYYQFKLAFEKSQSWKVLGNYGLCAVKLERDGEALALYEEYLRRGGKQIGHEERAAIETDLALIKGNGVNVELSSQVGALAVLDSRAGSTAPPQSYELDREKISLLVRAGTHHFSATTADGASLTWDVSLEPGNPAAHVFAAPAKTPPPAKEKLLVPLPPPRPSTGSAEAPDAGSQRTSPVRTAGYFVASAGVLLLGGGLATGLMANSKESEAKSQCDADRNCPQSASAKFDSATSLSHVSTGLLIGGGAVAAGGIVMIIFGQPNGAVDQASQLRLAPAFSESGAGFMASGNF